MQMCILDKTESKNITTNYYLHPWTSCMKQNNCTVEHVIKQIRNKL